MRTVMGELDRTAAASGTATPSLIARGYDLHTIENRNLSVVDLCTEAARADVGLDLDDIVDEDWTACQAVGPRMVPRRRRIAAAALGAPRRCRRPLGIGRSRRGCSRRLRSIAR